MPQAFLSSTFNEARPGEEPKYFELRKAIHDIGIEVGYPVWVAECAGVKGDLGWAVAVKACVDVLSRSDLLIVILASRPGQRADMGSLGTTASSVLEVELFHASNWQIPTVFFYVRGYEPEPELANIINILRLRESHNWLSIEENEIESKVRELLLTLKYAPAPDLIPRLVPDLLASVRANRRVSQEIEATSLSFIGRFGSYGKADFSPARLEELLSRSDLEANDGNRHHQLSFLWMAIRELSLGHPDAVERLPFWHRLANLWAPAGAWLGLHGFLNTGVVAAFHTRTELRQRGLVLPAQFGGYASEIYSIAGLTQTGGWKRLLYGQAAALASLQIRLDPSAGAGSLSVRASAKLQLARLGRPWLAWSALRDYQRAYALHIRSGADEAKLGETLVELAYAQFKIGRTVGWSRQAALSRMREGVRLQEASQANDRMGFLVRAKRKLSECLYEAGMRDEAVKEHNEAISLADRFGLADQLRQLPSLDADRRSRRPVLNLSLPKAGERGR